MPPNKPPLRHPPEVLEAIIQEHTGDPVQMACRLHYFGWTLAEAAWAAVHWDLPTLAAAVAKERAARDSKLTNLSDGDLAKLRAEIDAGQKPAFAPRLKRTTRIVQTAPRPTTQPPGRSDDSRA